jgi:hypothetical protein
VTNGDGTSLQIGGRSAGHRNPEHIRVEAHRDEREDYYRRGNGGTLRHGVGFGLRSRYLSLREWYSTMGFEEEGRWVTARISSIESGRTSEDRDPAR